MQALIIINKHTNISNSKASYTQKAERDKYLNKQILSVYLPFFENKHWGRNGFDGVTARECRMSSLFGAARKYNRSMVINANNDYALAA